MECVCGWDDELEHCHCCEELYCLNCLDGSGLCEMCAPDEEHQMKMLMEEDNKW